VNFLTPKFIIIRWYLFYFGSFTPYFQIKLCTCGSNFNFRLLSMNDVGFFCLKGVLIQNFNTVNFFLKKIKKLHIQITDHIEDDIMQNHEEKI
jgi:hypothetical protein